jgi:diaminohydroxyphosphoribosylaminopyrimidine deaminase/5-amino-6-(5-phosphoribosylamino)uracil reductase
MPPPTLPFEPSELRVPIVVRSDVDWMRCALTEAARGLGSVEPNPLVGAAVVREGRLVGLGHHEQFGGPHAEVLALGQAGEAARGATLYVTLEPCCHFGKTPPCTEAILAAGIARVVVAIRDPYPKVNGGGLAILASAGLAVEVGCEAPVARDLIAPYLKRVITGRPFVTAKWAMTLDGKTAAASGDSRWISSEPSRRLVHQLRGRMDAIVVGIGTVTADDPLLTARPPGPRCPVRIVLDRTARLPLQSHLVRTAREIPVLVAVNERATPGRRAELIRAGCEVIPFPGSGPVPIAALLEELGSRGMTNLLVEGGGQVLGSFLDAGQVDAVEAFIAPILEGGDHAHTAARGRGRAFMRDALRLRHTEVTEVGGDVHIRGRLPQPWRILAGFPEESDGDPRSP